MNENPTSRPLTDEQKKLLWDSVHDALLSAGKTEGEAKAKADEIVEMHKPALAEAEFASGRSQ